MATPLWPKMMQAWLTTRGSAEAVPAASQPAAQAAPADSANSAPSCKLVARSNSGSPDMVDRMVSRAARGKSEA